MVSLLILEIPAKTLSLSSQKMKKLLLLGCTIWLVRGRLKLPSRYSTSQ
ncbi:hypothetical protein OIU76_025224 [Salix suchowensis]|nr:hypothetical protein OIU76_025224 [Salix suchowensis]